MDYSKCKIIDIKTIGGYTKEEILNNKNCSKNPKYWLRIGTSNKFLFKSKVAESWEFFHPNIVNPIRNTNQIYLRFLDTSKFTKEADNFKVKNYYINATPNMPSYDIYWDEQEKLCEEGLEVEGVRITGRYYFSLNFGRLKARIKEPNKPERRIWTFLSFLDHQYYIFNELEECHLEGMYSDLDKYISYFPNKTKDDFDRLKKQGLTASKSRRKGFTYIIVNGIYAYNFTFIEASKNIIAAFEKAHYGVLLSGVHEAINFLNKYTAFGRRRGVLNTRSHFRASFKYVDEFGIEIEDGYMSEIECISFKDNPFKGIGDGVTSIGIEEAGKFNNLLDTYAISIEPLIRDGEIILGVPLIWGSAGDIEGGGSTGLQEMTYNPKNYGLKEYDNIYEENDVKGKSGWFIDDMWYAPSINFKDDILAICKDKLLYEFIEKSYSKIIKGVDEQGNSHRWISELIIDEKRILRKKGDSRAFQKFITQQPKYLSEAFLTNESSPFDVALAKEVLADLKVKDNRFAEPGEFTIGSDGNITWRNDFTKRPILEFPIKDDNLEGCWIIYNKPDKSKEIPTWRYIAATDPIDKGYEETNTGNKHSLAATYILDTFTRNIVAEYVGRPNVAEKYYEQLWRGIEYYSADLLYENNLKGLFSYFRTKNKLHLLANEPESLKDKWGYKSNNSIKGFHATGAINSFGRELIHKWTLEPVVVENSIETNESITLPRMWMIPAVGLLQEIILWNSKGNFDRISSLGAALILLQDREKFLDDVRNKTNKRLDDKFFRRINKSKKHKLWN